MGQEMANALYQPLSPSQRPDLMPQYDMAPYQGAISSYDAPTNDTAAQLIAKHWFGDDKDGYAKAQRLLQFGRTMSMGLSDLPGDVIDTAKYAQAGDKGAALSSGANALMNALPLAAPYAPEAVEGLKKLHADESGVLTGPLSNTWDRLAANDASNMFEAGLSPEDIWRHSGLALSAMDRGKIMTGADRAGMYPSFRQEISDAPARWIPGPGGDHGAYQKQFGRIGDAWPWAGQEDLSLGEVLHHPELYKAYPELGDLPLTITQGSPHLGSYNSRESWAGGPSMELRQDTDIGTALHEIQHGIQNIEGWAPGGNPGRLDPMGAMQLQNDTRTLLNMPRGFDYSKVLEKYKDIVPPDIYKAMLSDPNTALFYLDDYGRQMNYLRSAGENEANIPTAQFQTRAAFNSLNMPTGSNALISPVSPPPWAYEKVRPQYQIYEKAQFLGRRK
jgi:hypothetical protein